MNTSGAQQVEMWHGRMDANSATPPHSHNTEEVVLFLKGSGRATIADREVRYQPGDTLIPPPEQVHLIFAETESEFGPQCRSAVQCSFRTVWRLTCHGAHKVVANPALKRDAPKTPRP